MLLRVMLPGLSTATPARPPPADVLFINGTVYPFDDRQPQAEAVAPRRLGLERLAGAYAWRALLDATTIIAGGSDAPVERGEPLIEFYAAATRKDLTGFSGAGWHPEQAVSRLEALKS